jgi:hypothetical protein
VADGALHHVQVALAAPSQVATGEASEVLI